MDKKYALYLSYNRWLHDIQLDTLEYLEVAEATGFDPSEIEEQWLDGCYPQDGQIFDPKND